jgi:hypothetical protein
VSVDAPPNVRLGPLRTVFLAALLLSLATYLLGYLFSYLAVPLIASGLLGTGNAYQEYSYIQTILLFVFNPIICLLVFYRIGSFSRIQGVTGYFGFLKYAFAGGTVGYAGIFLFYVGYTSMTAGYDVFGIANDWATFLVNFFIGTARGAIDMALIAFAGVMVGRLNSTAASTKGVTEQPLPAADV